MPIWVRVRVRRVDDRKEVEISAKVNTGFTVGPLPIIRLPKPVVERLGFDLSSAIPVPGLLDTVGRSITTLILGEVEVKVVESDRESNWIRSVAIYMPGAPTVLLNDYLIEALGIVPERPGTGLWRFSDESKLRKSAPPEYYTESP